MVVSLVYQRYSRINQKMKMLLYPRRKSRKPKRSKRNKIKRIVKKQQPLLRLYPTRLSNRINQSMTTTGL